MKTQLDEIAARARQAIAAACDLAALDQLKIRLLGRKDGELTRLVRELPKLAAEERPEAGQLLNLVKRELTSLLDQRKLAIERTASRQPASEIDVTLPGRPRWMGSRHPITRTMREIVDIFVRMGFREELGPEIEDDWHNYTALNFKPDHPARDAWAGFYLEGGWLLRSHTSPVQIRVMETQKPPVRIIAPGRCYRPDPFDASHAPVFHQVEGLYVAEDVGMAQLKGTLSLFVREMFGRGVETRFSPSYFPFTEPSAELSCSCVICRGSGCPTCKRSGWLELMGCGVVHPNVIRNVGYDPERYTGFAFGMGVERIAMIRYGIDDIRLLFENDIRFLQQF